MERKYTGIILGKYDVGEADRLYTIFTLEEGKIKARAAGVKKSAAKLAGSLENFNLADISIMKKRGAGVITSAIVEDNFSRLRGDLDKITRTFEIIKIFENLAGEGTRDRRLFKLLRDYLEAMDDSLLTEPLKKDILDQGFVYKLLEHSGYKFEVNACVACGAKLAGEANFFSAEQGGIVCPKCAPATAGRLNSGKNTIKIMRLFFANSLKSLVKIKAEKKNIEELKRISASFLKWIEK